jgi:hypothetical protein
MPDSDWSQISGVVRAGEWAYWANELGGSVTPCKVGLSCKDGGSFMPPVHFLRVPCSERALRSIAGTKTNGTPCIFH